MPDPGRTLHPSGIALSLPDLPHTQVPNAMQSLRDVETVRPARPATTSSPSQTYGALAGIHYRAPSCNCANSNRVALVGSNRGLLKDQVGGMDEGQRGEAQRQAGLRRSNIPGSGMALNRYGRVRRVF